LKIYFYAPDGLLRTIHGDRRRLRRHRLVPYRQYLAEIERFLRQFETRDPDEADYFFVPINLIFFQFPGRGQGFADPWTYIGGLPHLGRKPHLIFAAGDFGQRRRAAYETDVAWRPYPEIYPWLDERFVLLAFESTADLAPQDIALFPYVLPPKTPDGKFRAWLAQRWPARRDLLYSFAGAMRYEALRPGQIRGGRFDALAIAADDAFVGTAGAARVRFGRFGGTDLSMLRRSVFTLCPAGFGRWTFRFIQAPVFGSIPVLLADGYVPPLAKHVAWDRFCLTLQESDLERVPAILRSISDAEIARLQQAVATHAPQLSGPAMFEMLATELSSRLGPRGPMGHA
jgi:hypothetical protein